MSTRLLYIYYVHYITIDMFILRNAHLGNQLIIDARFFTNNITVQSIIYKLVIEN